MGKKVREVMTPGPGTLPAASSCAEAARLMRARDVGAVIVTEGDGGQVCGIITDRDIVVRCVAEGLDPEDTALDEVCSHELTRLSPDDEVDHAVEIMKRKAIRRIPVVEADQPVGILSLGDLAIDRDPQSALGNISQAPPNR